MLIKGTSFKNDQLTNMAHFLNHPKIILGNLIVVLLNCMNRRYVRYCGMNFRRSC